MTEDEMVRAVYDQLTQFSRQEIIGTELIPGNTGHAGREGTPSIGVAAPDGDLFIITVERNLLY